MKDYTKDELNNFLLDEESFLQEVKKTNGYIFNYLEKEKILPNRNWLLKTQNILGYNFLQKYYTLTNEEKLIISSFFKLEKTEKIEIKEEQLLEYLNNNVNIPHNAALSFNIIIKNKDLIKDNLKLFNNYSIIKEAIERESVAIDDLLKLDVKLLCNLIPTLQTYPEFFNQEKYKKIYKEIYLLSYKSLLEFNGQFPYQFTNKDFSFVKKVVQNSSFLTYADIEKIPGIIEVINVADFMRFSNNYDLSKIDNKIIERDKSYLKILLTEKAKDNLYPFSFLAETELSIENLKKIFDETELLSIVEENQSKNNGILSIKDASRNYRFSNLHDDLHDDLLMIYLQNLEKNVNNFTIVDIKNFKNSYKIISSNEEKIANRLGKESYYKLINNLNRTSNKILLGNLTNEELNQCFNIGIVINKKTKNEVSANPNVFLYLINKLKNPYLQPEDKENIYLVINSVITKITKIENKIQRNEYLFCLKECTDYFSHELGKHNLFKELKQQIDKLTIEYDIDKTILSNEKDPFNIFKYETNGLNYSDELNNIVFKTRKDMSNIIIEKNIILNDYTIRKLILDVKENDIENINFLKNYINKHKNYILENDDIYKLIMVSPVQEQIFVKENFNEDIMAMNKIKSLEIRIKEISEIIQNLNKLKKLNYYDNEFANKKEFEEQINNKINADSLIEFLNLENIKIVSNKDAYYYRNMLHIYKEVITNEVDKLESKISNQYILKISDEYLQNKQFDKMNDLCSRYLNNPVKEKICKYISSLDFPDWKANLQDKSFLNIIKNYTLNFTNYNQVENFYKIKPFSTKENQLILKHLYKFDEKIFNIFPNESNEDIKNFLIERSPNDLIIGYNLKPCGKIIQEPYTKEQILKLYSNNYKKNNSYFKHTDVNFRPYEFLSNNFEKISYEEKLKFFNFFKENNPIIYAIMSHPVCWENNRTFPQSREEWHHNFCKDNLDFNVFSKAIEKIMDIVKNNELSSQEKNDYLEIFKRIETQYIDVSDKNNGSNKTQKTRFTLDETEYLYTMYMKNEPLYLLSHESFCTIEDIPLFIEKNIIKNLNEENIKNFLKPSKKLPIEKIINDKITVNNIIKVSEKILIYLNENKQSKLLEWINFEIETAKVLNEISYSQKSKFLAEDESSNIILNILVGSKEFLSMMTNVSLHNELDSLLVKDTVNKKIRNKI